LYAFLAVPTTGFFIPTPTLGEYMVVEICVVFRGVVGQILESLDGFTLLSRYVTANGDCCSALFEQVKNVSRTPIHHPLPPTFQCNFISPYTDVCSAHAFLTLPLIKPNGLTS